MVVAKRSPVQRGGPVQGRARVPTCSALSHGTACRDHTARGLPPRQARDRRLLPQGRRVPSCPPRSLTAC